MTIATDTLISAAETYARMGFRVFPVHGVDEGGSCTCGNADCPHAGKHPRIKVWQEQATTELRQLRAWWNGWPDANIGCVTGDGLFVLDKNGKTGRRTRKELQEKYGALPQPQVVTPSDGTHTWLACDPAIKINSTDDALGPGLDVKGEGGYVSLPRSSTPAGEYRFTTKFNRKSLPRAPTTIT